MTTAIPKPAKDSNDAIALEKAVSIAFTLFAMVIFAIFWLNAGGLWRDEVNTVNIAQMPVKELWAHLHFDSFPALWFFIVKAWSYWFQTDLGLRGLGFLMGLGILGALWITARTFALPTPIISIFLLGTLPLVTQVGTSLRAYGCGMILVILSVAAFWKLIEQPSWKRILLVTIISVLTSQCLYQNAIVLFGLGCGALTVALHQKNRRIMAGVIISGVISLLFLFPYFKLFLTEAIQVLNVNISWFLIIKQFSLALQSGHTIMPWIWGGFSGIFLIAGIYRLITTPRQRPLLIFLLVSTGVAAVCYLILIKIYSRYPGARFYLTIITFFSVMLMLAGHVLYADLPRLRAGLIGMLVLLVALLSRPLWEAAHMRHTNIDLIARILTETARKNDLIVLNSPWEGITFKRYYQGKAHWLSLPGLSDYDYKSHRNDLMLDKIREKDPLKEVIYNIDNTLQKGGRVWMIGHFIFLKPGESMRHLPPDNPYEWSVFAYRKYWSAYTATFIQQRATRVVLVREPDKLTRSMENIPMFMAHGAIN